MHRYDDKEFQFDMDLILEKTERNKQWGKWGPDDEWGTQNYVTAEDRINAAKLVKKGQVFALGLNFDDEGPQNGQRVHYTIGSGSGPNLIAGC